MADESVTPAPKPRRCLWWWVKRIIVVQFILVLLAAVVAFIEWKLTRRAGQKKYDAIAARLDATDPGWRFEEMVAAHNAQVPPAEQNSTMKALAMLKKLPEDFKTWEAAQSKTIQKGRLPNEIPHADDWESFEKEYPNYRSVALELREWRTNTLSGGYSITPLPSCHLDRNRPSDGPTESVSIARLLQFDALDCAFRNRGTNAIHDSIALLNFLQHSGANQPQIGYLIRTGLGTRCMKTAEQTLAWTATAQEQELSVLQDMIMKEVGQPSYKAALRFSRADTDAGMGSYDRGDVKMDDEDGLSLRKSLQLKYLMGKYAYHDRAMNLEYFDEFIQMADMPPDQIAATLKAWNKKPSSITYPLANNFAGMNAIIFGLVPRYRAICLCASAGIACERYRLKYQRWPEKLGDLIEFGVPEEMIDPYDGQPLQLKKLEDGIAIYSVGKDGNDDGGDVVSRDDNEKDIGFRLWDPDQRKVAMKVPRPKTIDELLREEREAAPVDEKPVEPKD